MAPLEISIPTTSTETNTSRKAYTLYHITLSLPLRRHEVRKRYSDFVQLNNQLDSETSQPPPTPLPPKSWLKSTISSEALTEERRQGLEAYLHAILVNIDSRWRSSAAWRAFLELPQQATTSSSGASNRNTENGNNTLDPNQWLQAHRDIKSHIHQARVALNKRDTSTAINDQHALSADAKAALVRAAAGIARCDESLRSSTKDKTSQDPGQGEERRRRDMLSGTRKEVESLETVLRSRVPGRGAEASPAPSDTDAQTQTLFSGAPSPRPGRVLGGPLKETAATRELDNQAVLQLQKQVMADQEQDVLSLGQAVARMKDMGIMINEELFVQNEMLGVVENDVERVQGKIQVAEKRIGKIS